MLTVEPLFGLCNRMQALDSVLSLARAINRPVTLVWNLNPELNCRFEDLFVIPPAVVRLHQPRRRWLKFYAGPLVRLSRVTRPRPGRYGRDAGASSNLVIERVRRANLRLLGDRHHERVIYEDEVAQLVDARFDFETLSAHGSVYIRTYQRFYVRRPAFAQFRPVASIERMIAAQVAAFPDVVIGVRIRRTDHRETREITTDRFIARMHDAVARQPHVRFFFATDAPEEEAVLRREFPDRMLVRPKRALDRDRPDAIQDALVDLYCLSATQRVLGAAESSFSRTAALLGDIELVSVHQAPVDVCARR